MPLESEMKPIESAVGVDFDIAASVVIIGAGGCGLTAALAAAEAGADVLVLEQSAVPAGTTGMSTGLIPAAGTKAQKAAGILDDTPELFIADLIKKTRGQTDIPLLEHIVRESTRTVDWMTEDLGLAIDLAKTVTLPGHSRLRLHGTAGSNGGALVAMMLDKAISMGVDVLTEAKVTTLFAAPDGSIRGVAFTRPDGAVETVGCKALILASSGFAGNPELVKKYIPEIVEAVPHTHTANSGAAMIWGEMLGAAAADMTGYQGHGSLALNHGILIQWITVNQGGFQVNNSGRRFSDESRGYSEQAVNVLAQPGQFVWHIYDERIHEIMKEFSDYQDAIEAGAVRHAANEAELAAVTGLPADVLAETLHAVKAMAEGKAADPFGRPDFTSSPVLQPPYCAVKVTAALFHTQGGLVVDENAQVLRPDGTKFPNLFAGGGAARGVSGPSADGYVAGNGLLTATTLGRLAGTAAAQVAASH
jgi:fumarate reductase flavoprotein subunit